MSHESKSKRVREWITACSVPVAIIGIGISIWATNKSIVAQQRATNDSIIAQQEATNDSIIAQQEATNHAIVAQQEMLDRQIRAEMAEMAYMAFFNELLPRPYNQNELKNWLTKIKTAMPWLDEKKMLMQLPRLDEKMNTRAAIALFGSEEVFPKFLELEQAVKDHGRSLSEPKVQTALLAFLNEIRVDILGEDRAAEESELKDILDLPEPATTP